MLVAVTIPLLNPNEPEARLSSLEIRAGQHISAGETLCTLETTKSTAEVVAEADGYVAGLRYNQGDMVRAGEVLCYLSPTVEAEIPSAVSQESPGDAISPEGASGELPPGLRITQPALALAREHGIDLATLPCGPLLTEFAIRAFLAEHGEPGTQVEATALDPTALIVYGGGGHGKSLIDLIRLAGSYQLAGVVDDGIAAGASILDLPVLGGGEALAGLYARGVRLAVNAIGGIGDLSVRVKIFDRLSQAGFSCPEVVHPQAFVEPSASLSAGVQVFPHAYVGTEASIGFGAIVNTGAIVSHDCAIGSNANISPGAMLAGAVRVGPEVLIGMGATINLGVQVGARARIGNGATVKADVPERSIVRAGTIWPE